MLEKILVMGYPPMIAKKALMKVSNESIAAALDAIEQIQAEESKKGKTKTSKDWICSTCTYNNVSGS